MRIFVSRWFQRFAKREGIANAALREAIVRAEKGQIDADLGGGVIKQRLARPGQGRSDGYRTIILFRLRDRAFFIYGFPKSDRANINTAELRQFKQAAHYVLALSDGQLAEQLHRGNFTEVTADE